MTRPIDTELRRRAVDAVLAGESCRAVAARHGIAISSVVKWTQRYRATGSVAPDKMGARRSPLLDAHRSFIVEAMGRLPSPTLHGLKAELAARGVHVSHNTIWLFLRREGLAPRGKGGTAG